MRKNYWIKGMLSLLLLIISVAAWADTAVFTPANYVGQGRKTYGSLISTSIDQITMSDTKGYYDSSTTELRLYSGGKTSFAAAVGYKITGIVIETLSGYNGYESSGTITSDVGSVIGSTTSTTVTWQGSPTASINITHDQQMRIASVTVTYVKSADTQTTFSVSSYDAWFNKSYISPKATVSPEQGTGTITYSSSLESVATVDPNTGEVNLIGIGTTTITADYSGDPTHNPSSGSYTLNVGNTTTTFPSGSYNSFMGESFTSPTATVTPSGGTLTYSSSNPAAATVDTNTGQVTLVGFGTTTITANYSLANNSSSNANYTLTIGGLYQNLQQLQAGATATLTKAKITFNNVSVTGIKNGSNFYISDGVYGATVNSTSTVTKGQVLNGTFTADVQLSYGATTIKNFLISSVTATNGTLTPVTTTIPEIQIANQGRYVTLNNVTFNATAKTFTDASNSTIANYAGLQTNPTLVDGVTYNITGVANAYNTSVEIMPEIAEALPASASISAAGYATFVAPFDINATAADVTVYTINTVSSASATLTPVTLIPKGTVVLLKGSAGTHSLSSDATQTYTALTGNLLKAAPAGGLTILDTDNIYLLGMPSGQPVGFYKSTAGTLAAGKGYLDGGSIAAGKFLDFSEETTGIDKVNTTTIENNAIYNLNGQKISAPVKGINLINGKKVVIK